MDPLYPLCFKEILRNYSFGERWIVDAFENQGLPQDHRVAETWEVCDRPDESSVVANGPLAGWTLHELIQVYGEQLLGRDVVARRGTRFPLLIKFLDASHVLGEQIHQSDELAAKQGLDDPGKTEAWYMLKVRDGATIRCGNVDGVTRQQVRDALMAGAIRECIGEYTMQPGDTLGEIAFAFDTTIYTLAQLNGIVSYEQVKAGTEILVPIDAGSGAVPGGLTSHTVEPGESLTRIGLRYNTPSQAIASANHLGNSAFVYPGQTLVIP